jgi:anti-sigma regulatory factor (Ser/Thr protein kinase)
MYTDGLTDRRSREDGNGNYTDAEVVDMLADAVRVAATAGSGNMGVGGAVRPPAETGVASAVALAAEHAVPGNIDDDMAILVLRTSSSELASEEEFFPAEPIMVSAARRLASSTFAAWNMDPGQAELACLLVSEVVTNAVLHASITPSPVRRYDFESEITGPLPVAPDATGASPPGAGGSPPAACASPSVSGGSAAVDGGSPVDGGSAAAGLTAGLAAGGEVTATGPGSGAMGPAHAGPSRRAREFALRLRRGAESVWVEVFDPDLRLPRLRSAADTDEGGRGLYLVEQLATRWGSRPTPEGKAVWFEIALEPKDD